MFFYRFKLVAASEGISVGFSSFNGYGVLDCSSPLKSGGGNRMTFRFIESTGLLRIPWISLLGDAAEGDLFVLAEPMIELASLLLF